MEAGMSAVVLGAFDLLHWGHIQFLKKATPFGPITVGLSTDEFLTETKRLPVVPYADRKRALEELGCSKVVPRGEQSARKIFVQAKPEFFVCGNDWLQPDHLEAAGVDVEFLNKHQVGVVYLSREHEMSSTRILEAVRI